MALDPTALDQPLSRELSTTARTVTRPLRYRLGDAFLPIGTAPPLDARLRCCTCGCGSSPGTSASACPLCGGRAWEVLPAVVVSRLTR